jgi:hypothetical protein
MLESIIGAISWNWYLGGAAVVLLIVALVIKKNQ